MNTLNDDTLLPILNQLDEESLLNSIQASKKILNTFQHSITLLRKFRLDVDLIKHKPLLKNVQFRNVIVKSNLSMNLTNNFKDSIEQLELQNFKNNLDFNGFNNLKLIIFRKCHITSFSNINFHGLKEVIIEKCNENIFKLLRNQVNIEKITVKNDDWTWNGFPHEEFNNMVKTLPKFTHLILQGVGTGSYFDSDNFPMAITKLETFQITFHWYVGIRTERVDFLRTQLDYLKDLTIHQFPYDFDGGRVLKFIIEEMKLDTFYYKDQPLILNKTKYAVSMFEATEIQVCCIYEMCRQFSSVKKVILHLNNTDIASDAIENIINVTTNLFSNVNTLEIIDNSGYRRILGVFLNFIKNFRNIESIKIQSQDRNINVLLEEFLPRMTSLKNIYLDSNTPRIQERLNIVKLYTPRLESFVVHPDCFEQARTYFENVNIDVCF